MTNKKISSLPNASLALTGIEMVPVVQASSTTQVSVNNLTVGRSVTVGSLNSNGLVTSGGPLETTGNTGGGFWCK